MLRLKKKLYNVAVIGENGMLGREVCDWLRRESQLANSCIGTVWTVERKDVDFSDPEARTFSFSYFCKGGVLKHPDVVINCAAYTDTKAIEATVEGRNKSYRENVILPAILAKACAIAGTKLIHISTDYVSSEYSNSFEFPANVYGLHKLLAEKFIAEEYTKRHLDDYLIVRTSWLFGPNSSHKTFAERFALNMYKAIADAAIAGESAVHIPVASNTCGFPTSTWFLSSFIRNAIEMKLKGVVYGYQPTGVFDEVKSTFAVTRADWAKEIFRAIDSKRDFSKIDVVIDDVEFPVPTTVTEVHHPQKLICTCTTYVYNSVKEYRKCIAASDTWKAHTEEFIAGNPKIFENLEKWIFSQLTDEQIKVLGKFPLK